MLPSDLENFATAGEPACHFERTAYVVTTIRMDDDRYHRELWLHDGSRSRPLTHGPDDTVPEWSPDGRMIAFLRKTEDRTQVAVIPVDGGEASVVTDFSVGVEAVKWSPHGTSLAVVAVEWLDEWDGIDDDERARKPRRIKSVPYRFDTKGRLFDRRRRIYLVDPNGRTAPKRLTQREKDEEHPAWAPDGRTIGFLSDDSPHRGLARGMQVFAADAESGSVSEVAPRGMWVHASYRPDGALHLLGDPSLSWPGTPRLIRVEDDQSLTDLTGHLDRSSVSLSAGLPRLRWDGQDAIVGLEDGGTFGLVRVRPDGEVDHLINERAVVNGFDVAEGRIAFTASRITEPSSLHVYDDGEVSRLSESEPLPFPVVEGEWFQVFSDGLEIDAWAYLPPGDESVPLLLNIHGGPASQYGFGFFDEFQIYAAAGFGVVACNPRGSSGKGHDFTNAVTGDGWGVVDLADVDAVVAAALDRFPRLDPNRMGVMGGSYGGFLTAWLTAHQDRWASAVVERALLAWTSFGGTSDIGGTFNEDYLDVGYPDGWNTWWEKSPLAHAHNVSTPTLVIHSEEDYRCPIEQAEQYFMALLRNGTAAEMLRFPGESHELSRSGKPRHRVERFEAILEWHGKHLL